MTSLEAWKAAIDKVSFRPEWPFVMRLSLDDKDRHPMLHVELDTKDINTDKPTTIHRYVGLPCDKPDIRYIEHIIRDTVLHELNECLLFNGKQLHNPHAGL